MASRTVRNAVVAAALAITAIGAYWYWSPYLAMSSIRSAAKAQDADAFNQHVDYPKLRESFKGQFAARMADVMGKSSSGDNDFTKAGAALGAALGMVLVDRMIDAMVRPEMVMKAMSEAKLQPPDAASKDPEPADSKTRWSVERKGVDRVIAYGQEAEGKTRGVGFVFDRSGFASWKLTEIRLPAEK